MKKFLIILAVSGLFLFIPTSQAIYQYSPSQSIQWGDKVNYQQKLIKFQPQFTVEGDKMITRIQAKNNLNTSNAKIFQNCTNPSEIGMISENIVCQDFHPKDFPTTFQDAQFEWYIWYETASGYSRTSNIKTFFAKFPLNTGDSQTSYSLFSIQGSWALRFHSDNNFIVTFTDIIETNPKIKETEVALYNSDVDYPILFERVHGLDSEYVLDKVNTPETLFYYSPNFQEFAVVQRYTIYTPQQPNTMGHRLDSLYSMISNLGIAIDNETYKTVWGYDAEQYQIENILKNWNQALALKWISL